MGSRSRTPSRMYLDPDTQKRESITVTFSIDEMANIRKLAQSRTLTPGRLVKILLLEAIGTLN